MMTQEERNKLAVIILNTGLIYGKEFTRPVVTMLVEDLSDLNFYQVQKAFQTYRKEEKSMFFPTPGKIREIVNPVQSTDGKANEAASRIREAITKYGWCNPKEAEEFIGPLGWAIVQRSGGWPYVCENHGLDLNPLTFHAQARELAKAMIESEKLGLTDQPVMLTNNNDKLNSIVGKLSEQKQIGKE